MIYNDFEQMLGSIPTRAGRHRLAGTVTVDEQPAERIVTVFDRLSYRWLASTLSDRENGAWEIRGMPEYPERRLLVVAFDSTGNYNAEVADYITQAESESEEADE